MKDTFSTYHPLLNMLYFVGVIGVTVFVVHPVILAISLFGGIAYSVLLKGWKKTVKFNLIFSIPMMLIVALMNPMFNHYGVTIIGYLHNGNPFTLESCVYGLVMAMMLVCTMIWFFLLYDRNDIGQVYLSVRKDHTGTVPGAFDVSAFCPEIYQRGRCDIRWSEMHRTKYRKRQSGKACETWDHDIFHSGNLGTGKCDRDFRFYEMPRLR